MGRSKQLFDLAQHFIPGGVNSPVRAFKGVGGDPIFFKAAEGAYLIDEDNQKYIDYVASWGPMIVGHSHPEVIAAVQKQIQKSLGFGAPTEIEIKLAQKICELIPTIERVRLVSSGTEATMTALRLARGYTKRDKILKFVGCYHGHADSLLVQAGSGLLTLGIPNSAGVPASIAQHTLVAEFNQMDSVTKIFEKYGNEIAAVIVEPVPGNMNCVPPIPGFLENLREICDRYQSVLIFDEVMTGFRVALGGAQARFNIKPDLTTLGKVIGGGLPVAAFGGKKEIMDCIAPLGAVYQAGTLSGNPVAVSAGLATLNLICAPNFFTELEAKTNYLLTELTQRAKAAGIPFFTTQVGAMFGLFFTNQTSITTYDDVKKCDVEQFKKFFHGMLQEGVYLAPSAFEAGFVSAAHGENEIEKTIKAAEKVFGQLKTL